MGSAEIGRVALMSIHPGYARQIIAGTKRVEFRKRPLASDVTHVLVYATAPISHVVGVFTVEDQVSQSPQNLWGTFKDVAGIAYSDLMSYYNGHSVGTGIQVREAYAAPTPLRLMDDLGITHPPQSYRYVDKTLARNVLRDIISPSEPEGRELLVSLSSLS